MRILQIGPIPPEVGGQTGGGVAAHMWALASHLVKQEYTVGVFGGNYYTKKLSPEIIDGIHLFGKMGFRKSVRSAYVLCPSFWLKLVRIKIHCRSLLGWKAVLSGLLNYHRVITEFKPDIIHIHHLEYRFPFVYYSIGPDLPIITTVHSTSFIEFSPSSITRDRKEFIRRNLDLSQNLIFVSQYLKKRFETLFPGVLAGKNTAVVHNPVDGNLYYPISKVEAREKLGIRPEGSVLLFVGNLIPQKSLNILIEAASILRERDLDFQILVVGSGPEQSELEGLVNTYQLARQVRFEGQKPRGELFLYYNAADLFVLPSAMESFGLVFIEAMLCGCPVIGRAEVLMEILPSERCGSFLPSSNPDIWADSIAKALEQSWHKDEIHEQSRVYTWEVLEDSFEKIYKQITG